jgi:uncharacterized protein YukE
VDVGDVVSEIGLWWPAADEERVRDAARAWTGLAGALDHAGDVGRAGHAQATAHWTGDAAASFTAAWAHHEQALRDDAAGARALGAALTDYADAVAAAKRKVTELAVTAGATLVAGAGLAWLTFGTSAAAAAGVSAALVAAAGAVGVELSATAAAIVGGALTGVAFSAVEGAVVDMAVTQPLRVAAFGDGGFSASEVGTTALTSGLIGGALGGLRPVVGLRFPTTGPRQPAPTSVAEDLGELDGRISAALDPGSPGALGPLFRPGIHETPTATFTPEQLPAARLLESEGRSVHVHTGTAPDGPAALVRSSAGDRGRLTELVRPAEPTPDAVERALLDANGRLEPRGSGDIVIDARGTGLDVDAAGHGLSAAITRLMVSGHEPPDSVRFVFDDRSIWFP